MSDFSERIENIASKLRNLLKESEELKQLVEQRMMLAEDTDASEHSEPQESDTQESDTQDSDTQDSDIQESCVSEDEPVVTEFVTRKPWCFLCCRRY